MMGDGSALVEVQRGISRFIMRNIIIRVLFVESPYVEPELSLAPFSCNNL